MKQAKASERVLTIYQAFNWANERNERKLAERKERTSKLIADRRMKHLSYQRGATSPNLVAQEDIEMDLEVSEEPKQGFYDLNWHSHRKGHKSRKKCWLCKSPDHLKKKCPHIRCFYCHRPGHIKANCYLRKINYVFNRLRETRVKQKQGSPFKAVLTENDEKKKKIYELRTKGKFEFKWENQGSTLPYEVYWNDIHLGTYVGPGLNPDEEVFTRSPIDWDLMNRIVKRNYPLKRIYLSHRLPQYCPCGFTAKGREFADHCKEKHKKLILKDSIVNQIPYEQWISYCNDDLELLFLLTDESLT